MRKIIRKFIYLGIFLAGIAFYSSAIYENYLKQAAVSENPVNIEATITENRISTRIKKGREFKMHHLTLSYTYKNKPYEITMEMSGTNYNKEVKNNKISLVINGNNPTKNRTSTSYKEGGVTITGIIIGLIVSLIASLFGGSFLCRILKLYTPEELAELDADDDEKEKEKY